MRLSILLIVILLSCISAFAQKAHPKDKEIEAAVRGYYRTYLDTIWILEEFEYAESIDISEKEYRGMAAGKFESYMFTSKYHLKESREEQERIKERKRHDLDNIGLQKRYDDTLAQLAVDQKMWQDMYDRNKFSLDSCEAIVRTADSVNDFGYLAFVRVRIRHKDLDTEASVYQDIEELILTKDLTVDLYMRLEKEQLAFIRE